MTVHWAAVTVFTARALRVVRCKRPARPLAVALTLLISAALATAARAATELDPERVSWSELSYSARKLVFSATTEVSLTRLPEPVDTSAFAEPPQGLGLMPGGDNHWLIALQTSALGLATTNRLWLSGDDAQAFQRDQLDRGGRARYRAYRFAESGVFSLTRRPQKGEAGLPHRDWSDTRERFTHYPSWAGDDLTVSDPSSLFYLIAVSHLEETGDRIQIPIFSRGDLLLMELTVTGSRNTEVAYTRLSSGGERQQVRGKVRALRVSADAIHLDPDSEESEMEFLGLRGDVTLLVDPTTRIILQVSGELPIAGNIEIKLQRALMR